MRAVRDICSWTTKQLSIKHSDALARRLPTETAPLRTPTVPPVPTRMRSQITLPRPRRAAHDATASLPACWVT